MRPFSQDRQDLVWLSSTLSGLKGRIWLLTLDRILLGAAGVGYAACFRTIVDSAAAGAAQGVLWGVGLFAGIVLVQFLLTAAGRWLDEAVRSAAENKLKLRLLDTLLRRDYAQVTAVHSGEWMNRLTSDTQVVANAAAAILPNYAGLTTRLLASAGMLLVLMPGFTVIVLGCGGVLLLFTLWVRRHLKRLHRAVQEKDGALRAFLTERLGSLMILRAYQQEAAAEAAARSRMDDHRAARMKRSCFSNFCSSGFLLAMHSAYLLGAAWCGLGIVNGTVSYGTFVAVIQLVGQLQSPIAGLTGFVPRYSAMLASAERLMEAEKFAGTEHTPLSEAQKQSFRGFGFRDVTYSYPDDRSREAVRHFTAEIEKGSYVAFTGPSGCGKSTVLKLLLCLFHPDRGRRYVLTDGGPVSMDGAWGELFAYVPQGNQLMSGTVRETVAFSCPRKVREDSAIWEALDIACAGEFVRALPGKLDTVLGERGSGLSEGQMQRLAIARALLSDRPVLLLDEATSALDAETEVRVLRNIRALPGKTVLIVTHRPAALEVVDRVIEFSPE